MQGNSKIDGRRKRKARKRRLLIIIVLLLLCVAAAVYIIVHFGGSKEESIETAVEEAPVEEVIPTPQEEPDAAADEKAAEHVYSHRGSAGDDELTIAAYDRAVEAGSKYLEADIVVSASGTVYLAHDDQAFDMTGYNGYFSGMTDGQIDALQTKSGSKVLRLKDLFDKYGDSVTYLVDVKYSSSRNVDVFIETVKGSGFEKNVMAVSSFFSVLSQLEDEFPDMEKLYVCGDAATFDLALEKDYVDIISVPADLMTADRLKAAHDNGKKFSVWTLNTDKEIGDAIELGVDTYFTDDSSLAIRLEKEKRQ